MQDVANTLMETSRLIADTEQKLGKAAASLAAAGAPRDGEDAPIARDLQRKLSEVRSRVNDLEASL